MVLGPIPIILKKTPEGDTLGNSAENTAASLVNEDKKAGKEGSRVQSPFLQEAFTSDVDKSPITNKANGDDLSLNVVSKSNANTPNIQTIEEAVGVADFTEAGTSVRGPVTLKTNKDGDNDISVDAETTKLAEDNIAQEFFEEIKATPNKFKDFATMTYSVSVYILGKAQYN